jgi:hypothetical protein
MTLYILVWTPAMLAAGSVRFLGIRIGKGISMKRRDFLTSSAELAAGALVPLVAYAQAKPCMPASLSVTGGTSVTTSCGPIYGLEWPGPGATRRMLYWSNPPPIYDMTYIFRVYPRKKVAPSICPNAYWTTFFWGNNGTFIWDNGNANTYYGAHPYPIPEPNGTQKWEISAYANDLVEDDEVVWDRWYTQAFRAWRSSGTTTHHEFYWDMDANPRPYLYHTYSDAGWADQNPPSPIICMGQAPDYQGNSWGGFEGWEEFNGVIRGIQIYSDLLSVADIVTEIASPQSTTAGNTAIWYLNLNPRPSDVTDKKSGGTPHNPSWDGTTALEWTQ